MQNPTIDFYILGTTNEQEAQRFACQLIEKSYAKGQKLYIHTSSLDEASRLDKLLWTFSDTSFLPHHICTDKNVTSAPIQIGFATKPEHHSEILFNLSREVPQFFNQFNQVIEIVFSEPNVQQLARDRFRQYRESGCEIKTYKNSDGKLNGTN